MSRFAAFLIVVYVGFSSDDALRADEIAGAIQAREAVAAVETILSDWLKAARECKSYDAKFTRWIYDPIFGDFNIPKSVVEGRLLFQRDGASRYDVAGNDGFLWRDDEYALIDWAQQEYRSFGKVDWVAVRKKRREPKDLGFWAGLERAFSMALLVEPSDLLPYWLPADHAELRSEYDLTLKTTPEGIRIYASKKPQGNARFNGLVFAFRLGETLPYAVQVVTPSRIVTHEFHKPRLDHPDSDAEAFSTPDLSALRRIDMREDSNKRR